MSLCQEVIPPGMISKFEYRNGNHFFISKYELTKYEVQKVLLYLTYDADTYTDAKAFVSTNLHLVKKTLKPKATMYFLTITVMKNSIKKDAA